MAALVLMVGLCFAVLIGLLQATMMLPEIVSVPFDQEEGVSSYEVQPIRLNNKRLIFHFILVTSISIIALIYKTCFHQ
jgi:hypothetical protein